MHGKEDILELPDSIVPWQAILQDLRLWPAKSFGKSIAKQWENYFPPQQWKAPYTPSAEFDIKMAEGVGDRIGRQRYTSSLDKHARASILVLWCLCFSISTASIVSIILVCNSEAWNMLSKILLKNHHLLYHLTRIEMILHTNTGQLTLPCKKQLWTTLSDQHKVPYFHN